MDQAVLAKLSEAQQAALSDELKAVYCALSPADQDFFAKSFQPKDLPVVLARKSEILKRNAKDSERIQQVLAEIRSQSAAMPQASNETTGDILAAAAGALGIGAAAAVAVTDNTAFYRGIKPTDLIEPLNTEFRGETTDISVSGQPDTMVVTVFLRSQGGRVPAMNINLTAVRDGSEIKVNELTTSSVIEALKAGGASLLEIAEQGLNLLRRGEQGRLRPEDVLASSDETLEQGASLAKMVSNLKLKDRAWKVIQEAAVAMEAAYLDQLEKERQARAALEGAWDRFYNCPTCGVSFQPDDAVCRVCGTARPEKPLKPDPRQL